MSITDEGPWTVDDLRRDDLAYIAWSGSAAHLRNVAQQLDRADAGAVDYLVVRTPGGRPVCKGAVDYEEFPGDGSLMQVATHPELQGRGLAQLLVAGAEERMRRRGITTARLSVEPDNLRALRLYEHLGYAPVGRRTVGWEAELEGGELGWYETTVIDLARPL